MDEVFQYSLIMKSRSEINRRKLCMKDVFHGSNNSTPFYNFIREERISKSSFSRMRACSCMLSH